MIASVRTVWKRLGSFLLVAALTTVAAVAALPAQDGALPIYPGVTFGDKKADIGKIPASFWAKGFPTEVFSQDDQAVVESWYRGRLKAYQRQALPGKAKYEGPGGTVVIRRRAGSKLEKYGKTLVVLDPS
jgi:hypothetical protein